MNKIKFTRSQALKNGCLGILSVGIALTIVSTPAYSMVQRDFRIDGGQYLPLCKEAKELANTLPLNKKTDPINYVPMKLPFGADDKNFSRPKWEELDIPQHMEKVKYFASAVINGLKHIPDYETSQIDPAVKRPKTDPYYNKGFIYWSQKAVEHYRAGLKNGQVTLAKTIMDINHDGIRETIYRFSYSIAAQSIKADLPLSDQLWYSYHFLPNDDFAGNSAPLEEQKWLAKEMRGNLRRPRGDLFYYKGHPYFSRFIGSGFLIYEPKILEPQLSSSRKNGPPTDSLWPSGIFFISKACSFKDENFLKKYRK